MTSIADYPLHDISKNYCKQCARADGTMLTFNERWRQLTLYYVDIHHLDYDMAKQTAYVILKKLPAWRRKW